MQNENNIFGDIPGLGDTQAFQNFVDAQNQQEVVGQEPTIPQALQPQGQPQGQGNQATQPQPQGNQVPQYTSEDIQRIIAENQQYKAQIAASQAQAQAQAQAAAQAQAQAQARGQMTPQRAAGMQNPQLQQAIARALASGYTPEQIYAAMQGNNAQSKLESEVQQMREYLQAQQYQKEQSEFIGKMTTFGDKWGLSEADLVTFANAALEKGINVAQVNDVEAVFRAIYPEQYAFRAQRMAAQNNASPIYGGTNFPEAPRATQSKAEDAYVEAFLKGKMPNAYGKYQNNIK